MRRFMTWLGIFVMMLPMVLGWKYIAYPLAGVEFETFFLSAILVVSLYPISRDVAERHFPKDGE